MALFITYNKDLEMGLEFVISKLADDNSDGNVPHKDRSLTHAKGLTGLLGGEYADLHSFISGG